MAYQKQDLYLTPQQEDLYVIGLNLKTQYGVIKPIKVKEYPNMMLDIAILKMADWEIKDLLKKEIKGSVLADSVKSDLMTLPLLECIQNNLLGLRDKYNSIFSKIILDFEPSKFLYRFKSQEDFDTFRLLILDYNGIDYVVWKKNKELRYHQKLEMMYNQATGKAVDFDAMFTSLTAIGHKPHDINDFTLSQFYSTFKRIQFFKAHETSTLFKTVDSKNKVEIIEWFTSSKSDKKDDNDKFLDDVVQSNKQFIK
jgi:hypothetical protein